MVALLSHSRLPRIMEQGMHVSSKEVAYVAVVVPIIIMQHQLVVWMASSTTTTKTTTSTINRTVQ